MADKKVIKVVYAYDIYQDKIVARLYYDEGSVTIQRYTTKEWAVELKALSSAYPLAEIKTTSQEYLEGEDDG